MAVLQQKDESAAGGLKRPWRVIRDLEEVPRFADEREEATFWMESRLDMKLMEDSATVPSESVESVTITLRMDPRMLARIKRLARSRYLNYQSMIKQWLSERLEQELQRGSK